MCRSMSIVPGPAHKKLTSVHNPREGCFKTLFYTFYSVLTAAVCGTVSSKTPLSSAPESTASELCQRFFSSVSTNKQISLPCAICVACDYCNPLSPCGSKAGRTGRHLAAAGSVAISDLCICEPVSLCQVNCH